MNTERLLFEREVTRVVRFPLRLYRPDGPPPPAGWPLVLFLHGAGEKGEDGAALDVMPLLGTIVAGVRGRAIVAAPQCPPGPGWPVTDVAALFDWLRARDDVDADAVYLTGISMGARGVWDLAYLRAADLAGVVAVCGIGLPTLAPLVAGVPAFLYHGADDAVVPVARSAEMAAALADAGGAAELRLLPDVGHECGSQVYGEPGMWDRVLARRRGERR